MWLGWCTNPSIGSYLFFKIFILEYSLTILFLFFCLVGFYLFVFQDQILVFNPYQLLFSSASFIISHISDLDTFSYHSFVIVFFSFLLCVFEQLFLQSGGQRSDLIICINNTVFSALFVEGVAISPIYFQHIVKNAFCWRCVCVVCLNCSFFYSFGLCIYILLSVSNH